MSKMFATLFALFGTFVLGVQAVDSNLVEKMLHNVEKVDITKVDFARTGKPIEELCQFAGYLGSIEVLDHSLIPTSWRLIQFKLKARAKETVFSFEIHNQIDKFGRYNFTTTPEKAPITVNYDAKKFMMNITLTEEQIGFAVWDIRVDHNISIASKQVRLFDKSLMIRNTIGATFWIKHSANSDRAFINFTFEDPDSSKEYCFSRTTSSPQVSIYVYVSAFEQDNKLTQFWTRMYSDICMSQLIYLRQLGQFNISFVFASDVKSGDELMVNFISGRIDTNLVEVKKVLPSYKDKLVREGSPGWWYNSPDFYDYTVVANSKTPLYVCDILANCYPYKRKQIENHVGHNETVYNFTIPEKYKPLLSHSPLIRVHSDDSEFTIYRSTSYLSSSKTALNRIQTHLLTSSPKLQINSSEVSISYQLEVPRQTRIPLTIPIELIDLRSQSIYVNIIPLNSIENRVNLVGVKVNGSDIENIRDTQNDRYILSTGDYVQQEPWKMVSDVKSFGIEFEVEKIGGDKMTHDLVGIHIELYVDVQRRSFDGIGRIPEFDDENCHKGPTYADLDCYYDEYQCPQYYFKYDPIKKTCIRTDEPKHQ